MTNHHGQFANFAAAVIRQLPSDIDETTMQRWVENQEGLARVLRSAFVPVLRALVTVYLVVINYGLSLKAAIKAGKYDFVHPDITPENFPLERKGTPARELHLVNLNRVVSTEEVLAELDRQGYQNATIEELLAFGAKHPELQREFPIVALGSVYVNRDGVRYCPYLNRDGVERDLCLCFSSRYWLEVYRFLAVRK